MIYIKENELNYFIKKKKFRNILIVTGKKSFNSSGFKKLKIYKNFKSIINIFLKKKEVPEINELKLLIKKINIFNPDLIIALGGGCVIDYAKLANGLHNIKDLKKKIKGNVLKINSKKTQILAIPTTAGSGAEATKFSVIYIDGIKYSVEHIFLKPDFYSLVPKLTINSSKTVRASSGFDAIAQAAEAFFSKKSSISSLKYSSRSLHYSIKNYLNFVNSPNLINVKNMLYAANYSGKAINIAKTNAPHALSYFFTTKFRIPHGMSVSIFFVEIFNFYYLTAYKKNDLLLIKRFNSFFKIINRHNILGFNNLFNKLIIDSGIKNYLIRKFKKIKYKKNDLNYYCNTQRLNNSPVKISKRIINNFYLDKIKS